MMMAFPLTADAQVARTGVIQGLVDDFEGRPLPGATVVISSPNLIGADLAQALPPGRRASGLINYVPGVVGKNAAALGAAVRRVPAGARRLSVGPHRVRSSSSAASR